MRQIVVITLLLALLSPVNTQAAPKDALTTLNYLMQQELPLEQLECWQVKGVLEEV